MTLDTNKKKTGVEIWAEEMRCRALFSQVSGWVPEE